MSKYGVTQTDFGWSNIVHTLQCPACDFQTLRREALQEHCTRSHKTLKRILVFSCPLCHARSTDVRLIDEHKRLYHTSDSVQAFASSSGSSAKPTVRSSRPLEPRRIRRTSSPRPAVRSSGSGDFAELSVGVGNSSRKREPSASTSSSQLESSEECSVLRRTVRKSSIRAIAAMTSPHFVTKESESSASDDPSPRLAVRHRRSSGESSTQKATFSPEAKQRRDGRLHPTVRAHMSVLFARGVRRPDEMAAQLRRFVKAEMGSPREDLSLQPSMWTIRRLLKAMAAEEAEEPATNPKRARIDLASPPPPASPEQRPRKIFTSSDGPGLPVVKLEDNHVELVRCLKCGVRVPFQSDGSRAAQDAALMAHLANSHGIRKRDPIVYPAARQRSQSAQDHVTDLDAEAEEGKAEIRILKETGVPPTAVTSSSVQVKLEGDEELRLTVARIQPDPNPSRRLKRPPAEEEAEERREAEEEEKEAEVELLAVRLKEPPVKEPPSERQQIDLDSLNTSGASALEQSSKAAGDTEISELQAEFSDLEKEKEEAEEKPEETEEKPEEDGEEVSPDELRRWAAEAMDVEDVEDRVEKKENDLAPKKDDIDSKNSAFSPERSEISPTDSELKDALDLKDDCEPPKSNFDPKNDDLEPKVSEVDSQANEEPTSSHEVIEEIRVVRSEQKTTGPQEWQCRHCFAGFEDEQELKSHVEDIHQ